MEQVEFIEERVGTKPLNEEVKTSLMAKWLTEKKLARNEKHANYVLIGIIIISISLTLVVIFSNFYNSHKNPQPIPMSREDVLFIINTLFPHIPQDLIDQIPDTFYKEDLPEDIFYYLPSDIVKLIPSKENGK
jgi:hypothetical protein